jgi:GNAT superfamily N-acetyltransferase
MFNTRLDIRHIEVRHFAKDDYPSFLKCIKRNLDSMANYLGEGRFFKGFSDVEFAHIFRGYVANEKPFEYFGVFYRNDCIGMGFMAPGAGTYAAEFIYWIDKDHMGLGVGTKLVRELTEHAFKIGYWSIEAHTDMTNIGSQKVLEHNGFGLAEKYSCEPKGLKDSGEMLFWIKFNPYERKPYGPKRTAIELLRPRSLYFGRKYF